MPPQIAHNSPEISAFNVAVDVKLKMQHLPFAPANNSANTDACRKACFQSTANQQSKHFDCTAVQLSDDSVAVKPNEESCKVCVNIGEGETSMFELAESPSVCSCANTSVESPKRSAVSPSPVTTPPTTSKSNAPSFQICMNSSFDRSDSGSEISQPEDLADANSVLNATPPCEGTKRPAEDISSERHDEDHLDELISAAEILYSCRNVTGEGLQSEKKRRKASFGRTKISRKQSDLGCLSSTHNIDSATIADSSDSRQCVVSAEYALSVTVNPGDIFVTRPQMHPSRMQSKRSQGPSNSISHAGISQWAMQAMTYLQSHGQEMLSSICAHYRIEYTGELYSLKDYSLEQLAHNAIFNPALPKANHGLPMMLRDVKGVTDFRMSFVKDEAQITRAVHVTARLDGEPFVAECRACSYCGSCFSGRFMKPNAVHQQAGGWKEITHRTAAGKFSWAPLIGRRLCVPCFTHWAANGTNVNANRPSIDDTARLLHSTQPTPHASSHESSPVPHGPRGQSLEG